MQANRVSICRLSAALCLGLGTSAGAQAQSYAPAVLAESVYDLNHQLRLVLSGEDYNAAAWQPWREALRWHLSPDFARPFALRHGFADMQGLDLDAALGHELSLVWRSNGLGIGVSVSSQVQSQRGYQGVQRGFGAERLDHGVTFSQSTLSSTLAGSVDDRTGWDVSAIIAYQELSPFSGFGSLSPVEEFVDDSHIYRRQSFVAESSTGAGVRIGASTALSDRFAVGTSYRSRIDMSDFASYRGAYYQSGEFDLPAIAAVSFDFDATTATVLKVAVERVMFSQVDPFVTTQLPARVEAALGDVGSPEFAWRDLTILRTTLRQTLTDQWHVEAEYATSQQPEPTSQLLADLLESTRDDHNLRVALFRQLGENGQLDLTARYNSDFILGLPVYIQREADRINSLEVQAGLTLGF